MRAILLLISTVFFVSGCEDPTSKYVPLDQSFRLDITEEKIIEGTEDVIRFSDVMVDARCIGCVWGPGYAKVEIFINAENFNLYNGAEPEQREIQGYIIQLLSVDPQPKIDEPKAIKREYSVKLLVSRE